VLPASVFQLESTLPDDAVVLDVGAWGRPFRRADWVLDHMPYETRGLYGFDGSEPERFDASRWVQHDICSREPWPFEDDSFDFVICSHTLEDVRDPIWVCQELARIGKAGYIEVPSRLEEQAYGVQGPWVGWGHHHWLVDAGEGRLDFLFKHHILHGKPETQFPHSFLAELAPEERVQRFFWEGTFVAQEKVFLQPAELDAYLADFVTEQMARRAPVVTRKRWRSAGR
jgi:SAM-dependent methyltransferase